MTVVIQRPTKGSRISTFYPVKSIPPLSALDSAFQLQEYISLLIRYDVHDVESIVSIPGGRNGKEREGSDDSKLGEGDLDKDGRNDVNVDEACWIYEQLRRLAQDLSHPLITMLQQECTRQTCPEMKAGEWLYLCVAHGNESATEQCCAIDYILHTLDSATALLNSPRAFPSRLSIPPTSHRHFSSLARRLGRIFAHAYYHHRETFEQAEAESSLYARFLALTSKFDLVPSEFLLIPPRVSNLQHADELDERDTGRSLDRMQDIHAELDPHRFLGVDSQASRERGGQRGFGGGGSASSSVIDLSVALGNNDRGTSPDPNKNGRNPSPRKFGRNRTDTMVYSEAANVVEELARSNSDDGSSHISEQVRQAIAAEAEGSNDRADAILPPSHHESPPTAQEQREAAPEPEREPAPTEAPPVEAPPPTPAAPEPETFEIAAPPPAEPPIPPADDAEAEEEEPAPETSADDTPAQEEEVEEKKSEEPSASAEVEPAESKSSQGDIPEIQIEEAAPPPPDADKGVEEGAPEPVPDVPEAKETKEEENTPAPVDAPNTDTQSEEPQPEKVEAHTSSDAPSEAPSVAEDISETPAADAHEEEKDVAAEGDASKKAEESKTSAPADSEPAAPEPEAASEGQTPAES
ncbi:Mob1/phocein [Panus rudis PR-1116 ss-1]|nr:Mob1/phocein [Panus rudis PR-1116 ss-1]